MSSANPAWLIAEAVATELTAAFANPTAILADADFGTFSPQSIAVIAPGAEENRPGIGARSWVNIYVPEDTPMTWETGNSYLAKPNIRVSVFVEETKRLRSSLHETCLSLSHFITVCLTRSTLNNVARRAPRQTGSTTHKQKGETQTWVSEIRLEYEYQGRGGNVNWPSLELGHDFGTVYLTATETRTIIIHNPGTGTLAVSSITVPDWITAGALPATVAAGASEEVTLTLDTSEAGSYTGDVVLATSAGTITTPVEVVVSAVDVDDSVLKARLDMGDLATGWRLVSPTRTNPIMTSNTAPSGVASASSVIGGGYEAWRAYNGGIATGSGDWVATAGVFPSWLQYQFITATLIKSYRITTRGEPGYPIAPKSWTLAGSNDGSTWTTLDTQSNITSWATTVMRTLTFGLPNNTTAYAYYRLTITAGNQNYAAVGELELCAALPVVAQPTGTLHLANDTGDTASLDAIVAPDWLSVGSYPATIADGATADITLTCTETTPGDYAGDVVIRSGESVITVPVSATVYAPA